VLLWSVKPAEEGIDRGVITRLWNLTDHPADTTVTLTPGLTAAQRTTHIETNLESIPLRAGALTAHFARQQLLTFRLSLP